MPSWMLSLAKPSPGWEIDFLFEMHSRAISDPFLSGCAGVVVGVLRIRPILFSDRGIRRRTRCRHANSGPSRRSEPLARVLRRENLRFRELGILLVFLSFFLWRQYSASPPFVAKPIHVFCHPNVYLADRVEPIQGWLDNLCSTVNFPPDRNANF